MFFGISGETGTPIIQDISIKRANAAQLTKVNQGLLGALKK